MQDPHPLLLLGEVHQLEVGGEGLEDGQRVVGRINERIGVFDERGMGCVVTGAPRLGKRANLLLAAEDLLALLFDDCLAQQVAQKTDCSAQVILRVAGVATLRSAVTRPRLLRFPC